MPQKVCEGGFFYVMAFAPKSMDFIFGLFLFENESRAFSPKCRICLCSKTLKCPILIITWETRVFQGFRT